VGAALRRVRATRYVLALREGGSLPGLVEADDLGTYVMKFHGAGQGRKALVAEIVTGELGRALGLPVPELVVVELDPAIAAAEPDEEVQDLLRASPGANLGMDYLPGSLGLESPAQAGAAGPELAAQVVWFDALTQNVDRSWKNPNLLVWHKKVWLIDHGASLYFHHSWANRSQAATKPYPAAADHVLLAVAGPLSGAHEVLAPQVSAELLTDVLAKVPDEWLADEDGFASAAAVRAAYVEVLLARVRAPQTWLEAVEVARAVRV
jgi:hypothetical protein